MKGREDSRVNWFRLFADLKQVGFSMYAVQDRLGVPKSTLTGWKLGAEPKHSDGERMIWLWCEATLRGREELPMIGRFDWRA